MEPRKDVPEVPKPTGPLNKEIKEKKAVNCVPICIIITMLAILGMCYHGIKNTHLKEDLALNQLKLERTLKVLTLEKGQLELIQAWQKRVLHGVPGSNKVYRYILHYYKRTPKTVARRIANNITEEANKNKIGISLITAIVEQESGFNPFAVSNKDARGLMQVRYKVWAKPLKLINPYELHEVNTGISSGIFVIKEYLKQTKGDLSEALYLYVGKDRKYVKEVFANIGKFEVFEGVVNVEDTGVH